MIRGALILLLLWASPGCSAGEPPPAEPAAQEEGAASAPPPQPPPKARFAKEALAGRISPASDEAFGQLPSGLAARSGMYGRREAIEALERMAEAAASDGIRIRVVSAYRSFADQKRIWEDKWTGRTRVEGRNLSADTPDPQARARTILRYSAMPGVSRHHWGTDFDLNSVEDEYFRNGEGLLLYRWLTANAGRFGFCQVYSAKGERRPAGYEEEKWHWSYMPLASVMLEDFLAQTGAAEISGFQGAETAGPLNVLADYAAGVNPDC